MGGEIFKCWVYEIRTFSFLASVWLFIWVLIISLIAQLSTHKRIHGTRDASFFEWLPEAAGINYRHDLLRCVWCGAQIGNLINFSLAKNFPHFNFSCLLCIYISSTWLSTIIYARQRTTAADSRLRQLFPFLVCIVLRFFVLFSFPYSNWRLFTRVNP